MDMTFEWLAAQSPTTPPASPTAGGGQFFFLALMVGMIAFLFLTSRSTKKREERKRQELYAGLTKNNRVLTVGGVIGTIMSVKDNEVVLKVDETTNTKMTFLKSAIQRTITEGDAGSID
jgi:preprotein translocase subunit YajC